jgi:hypothetical protein
VEPQILQRVEQVAQDLLVVLLSAHLVVAEAVELVQRAVEKMVVLALTQTSLVQQLCMDQVEQAVTIMAVELQVQVEQLREKQQLIVEAVEPIMEMVGMEVLTVL